jgi:hypothetical protein
MVRPQGHGAAGGATWGMGLPERGLRRMRSPPRDYAPGRAERCGHGDLDGGPSHNGAEEAAAGSEKRGIEARRHGTGVARDRASVEQKGKEINGCGLVFSVPCPLTRIPATGAFSDSRFSWLA